VNGQGLLESLLGGNGSPAAVSAKEAKALAYVRVSTDMQEDRGLSIPAQRKAIAEYAARNGIAVLDTYVEAASSYQDEAKRVEFRRMFERAKSDPQVSVVLVHESSRFSRHPWRTPQLIGELQDAGVRVVSVTEPEFDVNTVMGMWMQKVTEAKNASYSMEVAFHTRKGMRQNANARDPESGWCYKNGGRPSWGYRTVRIERTDVRGRPRFKAIWDLNREEVAGRPVWEWTREVLMKARGGTSLDSLQDMLNEAGVPSPSGGYWSASTLHSLLEPHMLLQYAGYSTWAVRKKRRRKWNDPSDWEVVPNAQPAIISEDEAKAIGKVREAARSQHGNRSARMAGVKSAGSRFVLSGGLFRCTRCGANMTGHTNRGRDGYICGAAKYRRGLGCGPRVFVEKELIEEAVWDTVQAWVDRAVADRCEELAGRVNRRLATEWKSAGGADAAAVRRRVERVESKMQNIRQAVEDGLGDAGWANARLAELSRERAELAAKLGDAPVSAQQPQLDGSEVARYLTDVRRLLSHADDRERRMIARRLVEEVTLDPDERRIEVKVKLPANAVQRVEAAAGVEPANGGFADLCLTTWLRRRSAVR
jgi:site-specific DNA recombinase